MLRHVRDTNISVEGVEGVESEWLQADGFGGALSAGVFDKPEKIADAKQAKNGSETLQARVIENDEVLLKAVDELKKAGALVVLAEPTLATVTGRPASLHVGGEFPIPIPESNGGSTIEFREFGTRLDLLPVVLGNGRIRLELRPCICEIDAQRSIVVGDVTVPGLRTRFVDTAIEMSVGQTFVLAGLVQERVIQKACKEAGEEENGTESELAPSKTSEINSRPGQYEMEATELIVIV